MTDEDGLFQALEQDWGDTVTLQALADWFDDHDEPAFASCLRWIVRQKRRVGKVETKNEPVYGRFFWELQDAHPIRNDPPAQLPVALWRALKDNDEPHAVGSYKSYPTATSAYRALLAAWKKEPVEEP